MEIAILGGLAFLAGLVDAVAGGGGLIQLPALFGVLPGMPPARLLGTNKMAAIVGTATAAARFARTVPLRWSAVLPMALAAFVFSFIGAAAVSHLPPRVVRPAVLVLMVLVAIHTFLRKDFGSRHAPRLTAGQERACGVFSGAVIGAYDGGIGPGTGSFLIFVFIRIFGFDFLTASASAKVVNIATNLAALIYFVGSGNFLLRYAVPMALCNMLGAMAGARLAMRAGARFIRLLFLAVLTALIAKFGLDVVRG